MNCAACNQSINRFGGYYLVGNSSYCSNCFKEKNRYRAAINSTQPHTTEWDQDNLLKAFRAYQERERKSACQVY